jgi:hypothetical protein
MQTPVALIIFNRPNPTRRLFERIAQIKPRQLFIIADGPRPDHPEDRNKCAETRAVVETIDWECDVRKNFSSKNLGVGRRPASGISWVFDQVDRAIILEDDCLPHPTFFSYCAELLEKYKDHDEVMHISGRSVFPEKPAAASSYYFSRSLSGWGWATWSRAWQRFDFDMQSWPDFKKSDVLHETLNHQRAEKFFWHIFEKLYNGNRRNGKRRNVGWDMQWNYAVWANKGLGIRPYANLIYYMGLEEYTSSFWARREHVDFPLSEMEFPLKHPPAVAPDKEADQYAYDRFFADLNKDVYYRVVGFPLYLKILRRLRRILGRMIPSRPAKP